jgi:hypothetical protein
MTSSFCEKCQHMREVRTARSRFLLCELSLTNTDYPKYPPQPVVQCDGFQPKDEATEKSRIVCRDHSSLFFRIDSKKRLISRRIASTGKRTFWP